MEKSNKKDVITYFIAKALSGVLSFVLVSILTYLFAPDIYGEYSLVYGLVGIFTSILIGWISSASLRYYAKYQTDKEKIYSNIFAEWAAANIIAITVLSVLSFLPTGINLKEFLPYAILLFTASSTFELLCSITRAARRTILFLASTITQYIINIGLLFVLTGWADLGIKSAFLSYIIAYFIASAVIVLCLKPYKDIKISKISSKIQRQFLRYGIPMVGVWAANWLLNYSDRYIINIYYTSTKVGIYDIGYKIAENSINMLLTSLSMAALPILVEKYHGPGLEEAKKTHSRFMNLFFLLTTPAVIGLIAIRDNLFGTILNDNYKDGAIIVAIISLSMLFYGFNQMLYKLWQLEEKTKVVFRFTILSVLLNIILNIIFIPLCGYTMAAITTLTANIVISAITYFLATKNFSYRIKWSYIIKVLFSCAVMFVVVHLVQQIMPAGFIKMVASVLAGVLSYTLMVYVLKVFKL